MQFGKRTMFLLVNAPFVLGLAIYFAVWLLGSVRTTATITQPMPAKLKVKYVVNGITYHAAVLRNGVPFTQRTLPLLYLQHRPKACRQASFLGLVAEPLGWWGVWLLASAMLLLSNNTVFSKGTRFQLQRRFPWVLMNEFFPAAAARQKQQYKQQPALRQLKNGFH